MGCNETRNKRKIKDEIQISLKDELLQIKNDQYSCTKCKRIPEIKEIDCENQNIVINCHEHGRQTVEMKYYFEEMKKNTCYFQECSKCKITMEKSKNQLYHCLEDDKYYCKEHKPNDEAIPIKEEGNKCHKHKDDKLNFCKTCNRNICTKIYDHKGDNQYSSHNIKNHEVIQRQDYAPKEEDLDLIYLFQKLFSLILTSYEQYPNNYYHCINITNLANFLKGSILIDPKISINDNNNTNELKINIILESIDRNKKILIETFNQLFGCKITGDEEKINLRDKRIGDSGFKFLSKLELRKLKKLILFNNNLSNIDELKNFNCPQLNTLNLGYNNIRDIDVFNEVHFSLTELDLNYNRIESINVFENMNIIQLKDLKILKLFNNNFYLDQKNSNIMKQIELKLNQKNGKLGAEVNNKHLNKIKSLDSFNNEFKTKISLTDVNIDLSSINNIQNEEIINKLKHPFAEKLTLSKHIGKKFSKSFSKNLYKNIPNLSLVISDNKPTFIKNINSSGIKFKKDLKNLKYIKDIEKVDNSHESQYTFIVFTSIKNNKSYLIYFRKEGHKTNIYLLNINQDNKILQQFEDGIQFHQIRYYIDVQNQRDIIIASYNNSCILWEFKEEKLIEIVKKNEILNNNELIYICMISDKKYDENYIIITNNERIRIFNDQCNQKNEITLDNNENVYFIDTFNYFEEYKYYIIIGQEKSYTSFEFNEDGNIKKYRDYKNNSAGENKSAIPYRKDDLIYLIGVDCKSNLINIFNFVTGARDNTIDIGDNYLPLGLEFWNSQYLIVSCRRKDEIKKDCNYFIKIVELDEDDKSEIVLEKNEHEDGVLSTMKFFDNNLGECLLSKGLDGCIKLWNC